MIKEFSNSPILKNFVTYSCSALLLRAIGALLTPINMHYLSPSDYGLLALAYSLISALTIFAGLGLRQLLAIEFFRHDHANRKHLLNEIVFIYLLCAIPLFTVLMLNASTINTYLFMGNATSTLIYLSLATAFCYFFVELFYEILRYQAKAMHLIKLQVAVSLLTVALSFIFFSYFSWHMYSIMVAQLIGTVIACLYGARLYLNAAYHHNASFIRGIKKLPSYLKLGTPFIPNLFLIWAIASADRWLLIKYASLYEVGIYSVADAFGHLFQLLVLYPLNSAYIPHLFKQFAESPANIVDIERWNRKNMLLCMALATLVVFVGCAALLPAVRYILPVRYHAATQYVFPLLIGYIFLMGAQFASAYIFFTKKTHLIVCALVLPAALNIGLNRLLIPHYKIWGCVWATTISYAVYFAVILFYNRRLLKQ